jgi:hypothetical protein
MWPGKIGHSFRNMISRKYAMARIPYSGQIPGNNYHPFNWKKLYNPMLITYKISPLSK